MSIIAKFHLSSLTTAHLEGGTVKLSAVSRGDKNASWASASPSGIIELACDESELQVWLQWRDQARAQLAAAKARAEAKTIETGVQHRYPHVGVEVFVTLSRTPVNGAITRLLNLDTVSELNPTWPDNRSFDFTSINGGGYTALHLYISNPPATQQMSAAHEAGELEWYMAISPSTDGYAGDGHAFRLANYPEGTWGHGLCGVCFGEEADH